VAQVKLLAPNDVRRRLDRYELIGEIASGGMATVYLARLGGVGGFQRFVAIKRLHPHLEAEPEFVGMFLDEARLAAGIHHPHVVPILEVGTTPSGYYLVMEYVEGDTLARVVARALSSQPPPDAAASGVPRPILMRILLDALAGLHAAHELTDGSGQLLGLIHRDVSPQNILVGVDGSSRITDFGVARATARLSSTRAGKLKGKLAYMSPEQTKGTNTDRRGDLFAMGVILWEVLAGQRLFKADSEAATLSRLLIEPIPPPSRLASSVPRGFDEVAAKALQRDPDARYQTAADMADAIERASRAAAGGDAGVASSRDVASYVQRVIGQEIAAQRESVRAWLAQSEPSQVQLTTRGPAAAPPPVRSTSREVTGTIPLDLPEEPPATERGLGRVPRPPPSGRTLPGILPAIPPTPAVPPAPRPPGAQAPPPPPLAAGRSADSLATTLPTAQPAALYVEADDAEPTTQRNATGLSSGSMTLPHGQAQPQVAAPLGASYTSSPVYEPDPLSVPRPPMQRSRAPVVLALLALLGIGAGTFAWWQRTARTAGVDAASAAQPPTAASSAVATAVPAPSATAEPRAAVDASVSTTSASVPPPSVAPPGFGGDTPRPGPVTKPHGIPTRGSPTPPDKGTKERPAMPPGDDLSNPYR